MAAQPSPDPIGLQLFPDSRHPPAYQGLDAAAQARVDLGHAVFNTQWVVAGTPGAARRDGLGPLFNGASCDGCHNEGARGRGPLGDGPAPEAMVVQLALPARAGQPELGDPRYGHDLNTAALPGVAAEGTVSIRYHERTGRYPDGTAWSLRVPQYLLTDLRYGALSAHTIVKPRLAPALFGDGLLEAVPQSAITGQGSAGQAPAAPAGAPAWQWQDGGRRLGRFGWQGASISVREQTGKAFAREMGLTNSVIGSDDCTAVQSACRAQPNGGSPEVSDDLFDAVVAFERWLAVPRLPGSDADSRAPNTLFVQIGCAACHRPRLPVMLPRADGSIARAIIAPYTDLRLHDLGAELADRDAGGHTVATAWRTAPLWGLGYRVHREHVPTFLHDGRARTIEEAILWHDGKARAARSAFEQLTAAQRRALLQWLAML
ncbi:MAG TPA: di-heme oxidoredictase family protein [Steroidobacteraceae bacterium]|nr:di-heme oxidoredictase family protein [Steroidobacteraceae bacterium]